MPGNRHDDEYVQTPLGASRSRDELDKTVSRGVQDVCFRSGQARVNSLKFKLNLAANLTDLRPNPHFYGVKTLCALNLTPPQNAIKLKYKFALIKF